MIKKKEQRGWRKLTQKNKEARSKLYRLNLKKREAWREFLKTPEGIKVKNRRQRANWIASQRLKKFDLTIKDLNPYKYFYSSHKPATRN